MILIEALLDLWRLLERRGRLLAIGLVALLAVSGIFEMAGMVFLFGYIGALAGGIEGSLSPVASIYTRMFSDLNGAAFAIAAGLVLLLVFALKNAVSLFTSFFLMRFAMKRYERIATRLFEAFMHVRLEVFAKRGTTVPQQIILSIASVFQSSFNPALEALSDIAIIVTMLVALLFVIDPALVATAGAMLGLGAVVFLAIGRHLSADLATRRLRAQQMLRETLLDGFRGVVDARLAGRTGTLVSRYGRVASEFALSDRRSRALDSVPRALNEMVLAAGIVAAAVWFAQMPGGIQSALPTLAVMGFAGLRIVAASSRLTSALQRMRREEQARQRLMEAIRHTAPDLLGDTLQDASDDYLAEDRPLPPSVRPRLTDRISVERVSFTYPTAETPAIHDLSLEIPRGAHVAFCGPSGGGKSTLALLIMGLLRPQAGRVLCDDWDIAHHLRAWHRNIGYVGQTPFVTPRNIRENVAFGYEPHEIDDDRVWRALEMASIADLVRARPRGLDDWLGEEGVMVSGGQRQRLMIARALYRDPEVLVFDEATAALDAPTEKEVTAAIARLAGEKTVISIAHRLTTIERADAIYLIQGGRIGASGTYSELMVASRDFRRLAGREADDAA